MSKEFKRAVGWIFVGAFFFWFYFQTSSCIEGLSRHETKKAQQEQGMTQDIPSLKVSDK